MYVLIFLFKFKEVVNVFYVEIMNLLFIDIWFYVFNMYVIIMKYFFVEVIYGIFFRICFIIND